MPTETSLTRRRFVQLSGAALLAANSPGLARGGRTFEPSIGACRSVGDAATLAQCGAMHLESGCGPLLIPGEPEERFLARLERIQQSPVPVLCANSFLPGSLRCTGPEADHAAVLAYAEIVFRRAAQAGLRLITFGSSGARSVPKGYPQADAELQFVALLARMGPLAEKHGLRVGVEPLQKAECNFIHYVSEAQRLVQAVQHPAVGITADFFHMLRGGEGPQAIREARSLVFHVHVAEKAERTPPGIDGDDFRPYLQALKDIGYEGLVSVECRWKNLADEFPLALKTLRTQIGDLK